MIRISLVIPAFNEEDYLPRLLDSVDEARERFPSGPGAVEVIVSDNGSSDGTAVIAASCGCRVVREKKRIIAAVRNRGAQAARGRILAFTDADNIIHRNTFCEIERALAFPKIIAGATGVHLERMSPGIAAAFAAMMPMVWATGMDTGVVFCRRREFLDIGGYDENLLFAEDVRFLWTLKKLGKQRGQRLIRIGKCKAITSTRKFDKFGEWHYIGLMIRYFVSLLLPGYSLEKFARKYWYADSEVASKRPARS